MRMEAFKNQYITVAEFILEKLVFVIISRIVGKLWNFCIFSSLGRVATELKHGEEKAMESMNELIP